MIKNCVGWSLAKKQHDALLIRIKHCFDDHYLKMRIATLDLPCKLLLTNLKKQGGFMSTRAMIRNGGTLPTVFEDFFKPWNEWFDNNNSLLGRTLNVPAVNITETKDEYKLAFAVPGMKKDDFFINVEGNMLTVSSEKEESKTEKEHQYTRKEYNYSSFSRSFSLPDEVSKDNIQATYTDGVLSLMLPKKEEAKKMMTKSITVK